VLHDTPTYVSLRKNSNCQTDFFQFLCDAISDGYIVENDYVILDNASVHKGADIKEDLNTLMQQYKFKLIFLPTYSPELNPCELVFNTVKNYMRYNKKEDADFAAAITEAFAQIDVENMVSFYLHASQCTVALNAKFLQDMPDE